MAYDQERGGAATGADPAAASGGKAAGKRALTDRLAQRAAQKNPAQQAKLGFKRDAFSTAAVDSQEFAHDVAEKQAAHGLKVDGVAGRKTVRAVTGLDPFDYLDTGPKKGDGKRGKPPGAAGHGAKGQPIKLLAELHPNSYGDGHEFAAMLGRDDGITPEATFQVTYANGQPMQDVDVTIVSLQRGTVILRSNRPRMVFPPDAQVLVTIPAPPELEHHGDGSIGDDHDDRLEA